MGEIIASALLTGVVTGLVTYGAITTKLEWMRADLTRHESALKWMGRRIDLWLHKPAENPSDPTDP